MESFSLKKLRSKPLWKDADPKLIGDDSDPISCVFFLVDVEISPRSPWSNISLQQILGGLENAMDAFQNAIDGLKDLKVGESGGWHPQAHKPKDLKAAL